MHGQNGHALMQAFAITNLAGLLVEMGRHAEARTHLSQALHLAAEAESLRARGLARAYLAVLSRASGRGEEARTLVTEAAADARQAGDDDVREAVELIAAFVRREPGDGPPTDPPRAPRRRARHTASEKSPRRVPLEVALVRRMTAAAAVAPPVALAAEALRVGPSAEWFQVGAGEPVSLGRRRALRALLARLVDARESSPSGAVPAARLIEAAWPGERMSPRSAGVRLRNAVAQLRSLGLREVLLTRTDGYMLDPSRPLVRDHSRSASTSSMRS